MDAIKISDTVFVIDGMTVATVSGSTDGMNGNDLDAYLRNLIQEAKPQTSGLNA
jgi:hypothetical protein